jgi:hypothetical protein
MFLPDGIGPLRRPKELSAFSPVHNSGETAMQLFGSIEQGLGHHVIQPGRQ